MYHFKTSELGSYRQAKQIHSWINNSLEDRFNIYLANQLKELVINLRKKGYIKKRNEFELFKELELRTIQFPGEQVYILLGKSISDYMENIYPDYKFHGAQLLNTSRSITWNNYYSIEEYDSAVFVKPQISAAHSFIFNYEILRGNRLWNIAYISICKFSIEIEQSIQEKKVILPRGLSRFSFN